MTDSDHRAPSAPSADLTSAAIVLVTCVFFLFGLAALTGSLPAALFGAVSLGAAMMLSSKMLGLNAL
ncbi:hypothetical protein [Nocardia sp. NPDC058633]|uniref:hypothetical protein n=1 Tax=Nocardia sp. NPDC058633 TaxID=3346568 RepID=UPI003663B34F